MGNITESKKGFSVLQEGGNDPFSSFGGEDWFPTYDEAIIFAINAVRKYAEELKQRDVAHKIIVYEIEQETFKKSHKVPCGRVVFEWCN